MFFYHNRIYDIHIGTITQNWNVTICSVKWNICFTAMVHDILEQEERIMASEQSNGGS